MCLSAKIAQTILCLAVNLSSLVKSQIKDQKLPRAQSSPVHDWDCYPVLNSDISSALAATPGKLQILVGSISNHFKLLSHENIVRLFRLDDY